MLRILCLFFIHLDRPENQKAFCIHQVVTLFGLQSLTNMSLIIMMATSIGVQQTLAGLPVIAISYTDLLQMARRHSCLKEFQLIQMPPDSGKYVISTKSISFIQRRRQLEL